VFGEGRVRFMGNDRFIGLVLVGLAALAVPGLGLLLWREGSLPLVALAGPAVLFLVGLLFLFTNLLETSLSISDELEELPRLVEDDIEDLRQGRFTWTHAMVAATITTAVVLLASLVWFKKWEATWGPFNILAVSAVMVALTLVVGIRSQWFQRRRERTRWRIFLIPMGAVALSVGLGLYYTEPREFGGQRQISRSLSEEERWASSRASQSDFLDTGTGSGLDIDCDGDECLLLVVVLIAIVSVVSSAFIPHFWVVAGHWLLTLMALIAVRELLFREGVKTSSREAAKPRRRSGS
jgi:hypothetical protein